MAPAASAPPLLPGSALGANQLSDRLRLGNGPTLSTACRISWTKLF
jgi:hypothetical protein